MPKAKILADLVQHPLTDIDDQIRFFGKRYKIGGQYESAFGKLPPHERLGTEHLTGFEVVLGLVVNE